MPPVVAISLLGTRDRGEKIAKRLAGGCRVEEAGSLVALGLDGNREPRL
jgi:hypothetical protein